MDLLAFVFAFVTGLFLIIWLFFRSFFIGNFDPNTIARIVSEETKRKPAAEVLTKQQMNINWYYEGPPQGPVVDECHFSITSVKFRALAHNPISPGLDMWSTRDSLTVSWQPDVWLIAGTYSTTPSFTMFGPFYILGGNPIDISSTFVEFDSHTQRFVLEIPSSVIPQGFSFGIQGIKSYSVTDAFWILVQ